MFKSDQCDLCGDCLVKCQWIEADETTAVQWFKAMMEGEKTPVVDECITCYACNEYCPHDARPFDLIAELQEKYGVVPRERIEEAEARLSFSGELRGVPEVAGGRVMSVCVFGKTDGHLIDGPLYDLPTVGGKPFFCWIMMSHMGAESVQRKHARTFVARLAETGAGEVVCFHDDCYAMLAAVAPEYGIEVPFRPVHLSEYLVERLAARKGAIEPLNLAVAYQRPCASRHTPEKEHFIDALFALCGVRRVVREYDRENALCCAGVKLMLDKGDPGPDVAKNVADAVSAGAEAMVCLCPMCIHSLGAAAGEQGLPLIFLGDIARMAVGEIPVPGRGEGGAGSG